MTPAPVADTAGPHSATGKAASDGAGHPPQLSTDNPAPLGPTPRIQAGLWAPRLRAEPGAGLTTAGPNTSAAPQAAAAAGGGFHVSRKAGRLDCGQTSEQREKTAADPESHRPQSRGRRTSQAPAGQRRWPESSQVWGLPVRKARFGSQAPRPTSEQRGGTPCPLERPHRRAKRWQQETGSWSSPSRG